VEIYFNPYPGASKDEREGLRCIVEAADAFVRMKMELQNLTLSGRFADDEVRPSRFVLVRSAGMELGIKDILHKTVPHDRVKIHLLLQTFSTGKVLDEQDIKSVDNWVITNIGVPAPILETAAKNKALALTIPTEPEWRCDILHFENRHEILHNLWGQNDVSNIVNYCIDSLKNTEDRFCTHFGAVFCDAALNDAPHPVNWDNLGFFTTMEKAKKRQYEVDDNLIKNVTGTKHGPLLELRVYGPGHRIFFVHRKGMSPELLIGGFYQKNQAAGQNDAITNAQKRINEYQVHGDI
jgi:putative component of toxin-antitoxin plasmid stabilization module